MTTDKTPFTLHPEYKDFVPGVSKLQPADGGGCLLLMFFTGVVMLMFLGFWIQRVVVMPVLLMAFDEVTTGQVIGCRLEENKQRDLFPLVTYVYTWNNAEFEDQERLSKENDACDHYLNQPIVVYLFAPDPSFSRLTPPGGPSLPLGGLTLVLGVPMFLGTVAATRLFRMTRRFKRMCDRLNVSSSSLVEGTIVEIEGETDAKSKDFYVSVVSEFHSPSGEILMGLGYAHRQDLQGTELPAVGTPVSILYADDETYLLL